MFVLDSDILSLYQRGNLAVTREVSRHDSTELAVTVISVEEQLSGWYTLLRRVKQRSDLARAYRRLGEAVVFLAGFPILSLTEQAILCYEGLLAMKLGVRRMDLRIASIVLENSATLVTRNVRDFQRVPGLVVENWAL